MEKNPMKTKMQKIRMGAKRKNIPLKMSTQEFEKWYSLKPKKCEYCTIPEVLIPKTSINPHYWKLTIDRKNSASGYSIENICLACVRCNTSKSNYIPYLLMKEIAIKYLEPLWKEEIKHAHVHPQSSVTN